VLVDVFPLFGLTISTPRLELRLPREEELAELADLAGQGVHRPGERPFLTPWTDGTHADRARMVLRGHWHALAGWEPDAWQLSTGVFRDGQPLGIVTLHARDFAVARQVNTWSWLGLDHHGQGYGTEARAGLLSLAFDHLGATDALSGAFRDNIASQSVSRKLGYEPDGITIDARDGEALVSDRLRLTATRWRSLDRPAVIITGLDRCRSAFGL